jgi:hypothetical protein
MRSVPEGYKGLASKLHLRPASRLPVGHGPIGQELRKAKAQKDRDSGRPGNGGTLRMGQTNPDRSKGAATSTLAQAVMGRNRPNEGSQRNVPGLYG